MPVGQNYADNIIESVTDVAKVRQNNVNARLVFLWEQHSTVNDQQLAVYFEHGHVSTDFTDATEGNDAQDSASQRCWRGKGLNHWFSFHIQLVICFGQHCC
jgi:hypothetical protein